MNDDFEEKLQRLAGATRRGNPTPVWKADILARARREAGDATPRRTGPPRVLLAAWAMAWAVTILLSLVTPRDGASPSNAGPDRMADGAHLATAPTLAALEREYHVNDLP